METSKNPMQKRKRISKKNRSAWRKTDIQDVEKYLEEQRQEERIGKIQDKPDEEIFQIDTTPADNKRTKLSLKAKRKLNALKPMRTYAPLENTSKVTDPIAKRNTVKLKKTGSRNVVAEVTNPTKTRHVQANQDRERYYQQLDKRLKRDKTECFKKDIWAEKDFRDEMPALKDEKGWVSKQLAKYVMDNVGKKVIKVHDSLRHRTTKAKNTILPHPGMSYNPSLKDHQALLGSIVEREEKIIKEEKHLKRVTTDMFSKVTAEERDKQRLAEMSAGLFEDEEQENGEAVEDTKSAGKERKRKTSETAKLTKKKQKSTHKETDGNNEEAVDETDAPYKSVNPPVQNKKKTKTIRNKEDRHKELLKRQEEKKERKQRLAELNRLKSLKAQVLEEEEKLNEAKKRRKKVEMKKKFETKRLGRVKFQEPDVDVNMAEDIAGNLRNVKTESNLLVDRFKNFQKRNILPAGVPPTKQKRKKVKRFVRKSHKEAEVSFQMLREKRKTG